MADLRFEPASEVRVLFEPNSHSIGTLRIDNLAGARWWAYRVLVSDTASYAISPQADVLRPERMAIIQVTRRSEAVAEDREDRVRIEYVEVAPFTANAAVPLEAFAGPGARRRTLAVVLQRVDPALLSPRPAPPPSAAAIESLSRPLANLVNRALKRAREEAAASAALAAAPGADADGDGSAATEEHLPCQATAPAPQRLEPSRERTPTPPAAPSPVEQRLDDSAAAAAAAPAAAQQGGEACAASQPGGGTSPPAGASPDGAPLHEAGPSAPPAPPAAAPRAVPFIITLIEGERQVQVKGMAHTEQRRLFAKVGRALDREIAAVRVVRTGRVLRPSEASLGDAGIVEGDVLEIVKAVGGELASSVQ
jgi:hypothetical protein